MIGILNVRSQSIEPVLHNILQWRGCWTVPLSCTCIYCNFVKQHGAKVYGRDVVPGTDINSCYQQCISCHHVGYFRERSISMHHYLVGGIVFGEGAVTFLAFGIGTCTRYLCSLTSMSIISASSLWHLLVPVSATEDHFLTGGLVFMNKDRLYELTRHWSQMETATFNGRSPASRPSQKSLYVMVFFMCTFLSFFRLTMGVWQ